MDDTLVVPRAVDMKLLESFDEAMKVHGFQCKMVSKSAFHAIRFMDENTKLEALIARKSHLDGWLYEVSFSINWRDVFDIIQIGWRFPKKVSWRQGGVLGVGSGNKSVPEKWKSRSFHFHTLHDVPELCGRLQEFTGALGLPFYERWHSRKKVTPEFIEPRPEVESIALGKIRVSQIAICMAIIDKMENIDDFLMKHRDYIGLENQYAQDRFEDFLASLTENGILR